MKAGIGKVVASTKGKARGLTVYHELTPDLYSAASNTFIGRAYRAARAAEHRGRRRQRGDRIRKLKRNVVASSPDLIVLADSICCGQKASTVAARPGWGSIAAVERLDRPHRRLDRIPLGAASRGTSSARCRVPSIACAPEIRPWRSPP